MLRAEPDRPPRTRRPLRGVPCRRRRSLCTPAAAPPDLRHSPHLLRPAVRGVLLPRARRGRALVLVVVLVRAPAAARAGRDLIPGLRPGRHGARRRPKPERPVLRSALAPGYADIYPGLSLPHLVLGRPIAAREPACVPDLGVRDDDRLALARAPRRRPWRVPLQRGRRRRAHRRCVQCVCGVPGLFELDAGRGADGLGPECDVYAAAGHGLYGRAERSCTRTWARTWTWTWAWAGGVCADGAAPEWERGEYAG